MIVLIIVLAGVGINTRESPIEATKGYLTAMNSRNANHIRAIFCDPNKYSTISYGPEPITYWHQDLDHTTYTLTFEGLRSAVVVYQGPVTLTMGGVTQATQSGGHLTWKAQGWGWCLDSY